MNNESLKKLLTETEKLRKFTDPFASMNESTSKAFANFKNMGTPASFKMPPIDLPDLSIPTKEKNE